MPVPTILILSDRLSMIYYETLAADGDRGAINWDSTFFITVGATLMAGLVVEAAAGSVRFDT